MAPAGNAAVTAACYSILPAFVEASLDMARTNTTFDRVIDQWCRCTTSGSAPDGAEGAVGRTDEERPVGTTGLVAVDRCAGVDIEEAASIGC